VILRRTGEHGVSPYAVRVPPTTIADLLTLLVREPGRPRITWYGDDGERVELSGAVLENWVNKTANLLVEELDAGPGTRVLLDLPGHWRTTVWATAVWRVGACVVLDPTTGTTNGTTNGVDVVVTTDPSRHPAARDVLAVPLPALARRFDGPLPDGAVDAAAAVMTQGDRLGWVPALDGTADAIVVDGVPVPHRDLLRRFAGPEGPDRVLAVATGTAATLDVALRTWAADGSLVLLSPGLDATLRADPARRSRVLDPERVTRLDPTAG